MIVPGRSLYARLVMRMGAVLAVSACVLIFAIWVSTRLAVDEAYDRLLTGSALQIAENTWYQNGSVTVDIPLAAFAMLTPGDRVLYTVIDPNGRSVAGDPEFKPQIPWDKLESGPIVMDGFYDDVPIRIAVIGRRMPIASGNPWAAVAMAQSQNSRIAFTKSFAGKVLLVILATGVLTAIAAMFTLYQALSPLKRIESALQQRNLNDLSPLAIMVPTEILALVSAINAFMDRLAARRALMRRVIGNAAHQLRTPVTALISQMELLSVQTDEAGRNYHVSRLRERTQGLGALVNQLINHAMVQHRADAVPFERVDLGTLARREMADLLSKQDRLLDVEMRAPDHPCCILGDPVSLREAIRNILDNALKYGARSFLHVELAEPGERLELRFTDDGPGIPEADWTRVREPFSARGSEREGASLGLSIVEEVMRAHDGRLCFQRMEACGFTVILDFPRAH